MIRMLSAISAKVNGFFRNFCAFLLFAMMILGAADVGGRYFFNKPILGTLEIFEILLPAMVVLGLGYTQEDEAHIRVELVLALVSKRTRILLSLFSCFLALLMCLIFSWRGLLVTLNYYEMGRVIGTIGVPLWVPHIVVPVGFGTMSLVLFVQGGRLLARLRESCTGENS